MGFGSGRDGIIDKATDQFGNVYILANNGAGLANVDGHYGIGSKDLISLASWDCGGNFRWMKTYGGGSFATLLKGLSLGTDTVGNVYVSGYLTYTTLADSVYFDTDTVLTNATGQRFFMIKYSTAGNMLWFGLPITGPNLSDAKFFEMAVAPSGAIYQLAQLTPGSYGNNSFSIATRGFYVIRYDANGTYQAVTKLDMQTLTPLPGHTGSYFSFVRDHRSGRYYIAGSYNASSMSSNFTVGTMQIVTADTFNYWPMYVAAFDASGNSLWVKQGNSGITGWATLAPVDTNGNIYVGGLSHTGNTFAGHSIVNAWGWSSVNYIVSLDSSGNKRWGTNARLQPTCTYPSNYYDITCLNDTVAFVATNNGNLQWGTLGFAVSTQSAQGYLARFNATTGSILTLDSIIADELSEPTAVVMDRKGNIFTGGEFRTTVTLAGNQVSIIDTILYAVDWFVAKYGRNDTCSRKITSIAQVSEDVPLIIFPNPADDLIRIRTVGGKFDAEVFNVTGATVARTRVSDSHASIDVSMLSAGVYVLRLRDMQGKHYYGRFVKNR